MTGANELGPEKGSGYQVWDVGVMHNRTYDAKNLWEAGVTGSSLGSQEVGSAPHTPSVLSFGQETSTVKKRA